MTTENENSDAASETDETLIVRYAQGDMHALRVLMGRHRKNLVTFLDSILSQKRKWLHSRVEDVSAAVWVEVASCARFFEQRSTFKTWLFAIAIRTAHRHAERLLKIARRERQTALDENGDETVRQEEVDPRAPLPVTAVRREFVTDLDAALETLPPEHRAAFELRERQNLSWPEIAARLGRTEASVRSYVQQATLALRTLLRKHARTPAKTARLLKERLRKALEARTRSGPQPA